MEFMFHLRKSWRRMLQMHCDLCLLVIVLLVSSQAHPSLAQMGREGDMGKARGTPYELNGKYNRVLRTADWELLARLKTDDDLGIGLQAAWEHVRRALPGQRPDYERTMIPRLDRATVGRFLGYVEGRLNVAVPNWWQKALLDGRGQVSTNGVQIYDFGNGKGGNYFEQSFGEGEKDIVNAPGGIKITGATKEYVGVRMNDNALRIPLANEQIPWGLNVGQIDETQFVAVLHNQGSATCDIVGINTRNDSGNWREKVWGEVPVRFRQGPGWFHWIDFRVRQGDIIVFGLMNDVAYVEGFTSATGGCLFRFSTSYCTPIEDHPR